MTNHPATKVKTATAVPGTTIPTEETQTTTTATVAQTSPPPAAAETPVTRIATEAQTTMTAMGAAQEIRIAMEVLITLIVMVEAILAALRREVKVAMAARGIKIATAALETTMTAMEGALETRAATKIATAAPETRTAMEVPTIPIAMEAAIPEAPTRREAKIAAMEAQETITAMGLPVTRMMGLEGMEDRVVVASREDSKARDKDKDKVVNKEANNNRVVAAVEVVDISLKA